MKNVIWIMLSLATLALTNEASANSCWYAPYFDTDGDGYAAAGAPTYYPFYVEYSSDLGCPLNYVSKRGDCDDSDPDVHPRRREAGPNGIDDNCNGKVDEPDFIYYLHGNSNTTDGFAMRVRLNDQEIYDANGSSLVDLGYQVEYQRLENTGTTYTTPKYFITATLIWPIWVHPSIDIELDDLLPGKVYRARVQFYKRTGRGTPVKIGEKSDWYYTMTDYSYSLGKARTDVVLRAFKEFYYSETRGTRGYLAPTYPDGTRYTADEDEHWCSEFYSWVVDKEFDLGQHATANQIVNAFEAEHTSAYRNGSSYNLANLAMPGDYLAFDWSNDGLDHSGMFLAYDSNSGKVYAVEGNTTGYSQGESRKGSNEVYVRRRSTGDIDGFGRLSFLDLQ
jgi:hypothetical protein